jgi:hypothetical protein
VYVDVWFGTDPNKLNPLVYQQKLTKSLLTTVQVNAPAVGGLQKYYWQVDSYIYGSPTGTPIIGDVFEFSSTDDAPPTVVIDTLDTVTWANKPVQLNATVTDVGSSAVTIAWTASDPNAVFTPSAAVEDPVVTVDYAAGNVTLTCSVKDGFNPTVTNTDTVVLEVYADACAAARDGADLGATHQADIVAPFCKIDLADLAVIAMDWTTDYTILVPTPIP